MEARTEKQKRQINTFHALQKIPHPPTQTYSIFAYFLNESTSHPSPSFKEREKKEKLEEGKEKIEEKEKEKTRGYIISLGCYEQEEKASHLVNHLRETTGHKAIFYAPTCSWQELKSPFSLYSNSNSQKEGQKEEKKKEWLKEKLLQEYRKTLEEEETLVREKQLMEWERLQEIEKEHDPNSFEYYLRNRVVAHSLKQLSEFYLNKWNEIREQYESLLEKFFFFPSLSSYSSWDANNFLLKKEEEWKQIKLFFKERRF